MEKALKKNIKENKKDEKIGTCFITSIVRAISSVSFYPFHWGKMEIIFVTIASLLIHIRFSDLFHKVFFRLLYNS